MSKKEKAKQRPQALNTVEMLRVASSALGMHHFISCNEVQHVCDNYMNYVNG